MHPESQLWLCTQCIEPGTPPDPVSGFDDGSGFTMSYKFSIIIFMASFVLFSAIIPHLRVHYLIFPLYIPSCIIACAWVCVKRSSPLWLCWKRAKTVRCMSAMYFYVTNHSLNDRHPHEWDDSIRISLAST